MLRLNITGFEIVESLKTLLNTNQRGVLSAFLTNAVANNLFVELESSRPINRIQFVKELKEILGKPASLPRQMTCSHLELNKHAEDKTFEGRIVLSFKGLPGVAIIYFGSSLSLSK